MPRIRLGRAYRLPDGNEYIALYVGREKYFLYRMPAGFVVPPAYVLNADGQIINWLTNQVMFDIKDLEDTGRDV